MEIKFKDKSYKLIGWSRVKLESEDYKYYKSCIDEILNNAKFYTKEHGLDLDYVYENLGPFLENFGDKYVSHNHPNKIFIFSRFIYGTFIAEEI